MKTKEEFNLSDNLKQKTNENLYDWRIIGFLFFILGLLVGIVLVKCAGLFNNMGCF